MKHIIFLFLSCLSILVHAPINNDDAQKIGMQIWQNEADKKLDLIVDWSPYENFPSLGIGHFIWYTQFTPGAHDDDFPLLCKYLENHGVKLAKWLKKALNSGAPWKTPDDFFKDTARRKDLLDLLSSTITLQVNFMIEEFTREWQLILKAAPQDKKDTLIKIYNLMNSSLLGRYALIDYHNFKGAGLSGLEPWGLLQVLLGMPDNLTARNVQQAFAIEAAKALIIHIEHSGPEYNNMHFFKGWMERVNTYADTTLFNT